MLLPQPSLVGVVRLERTEVRDALRQAGTLQQTTGGTLVTGRATVGETEIAVSGNCTLGET